MKINAKTNLVVRRIVTAVIFLALSVITIALIYASLCPKTITVSSDTAVIRLPGEFEGRAKVLYNTEYVTQERENTTIKLFFEKQGYYLVDIAGESYIFEVMGLEDSDYTVDMVSKELSNIHANVILNVILISFVVIAAEVIVLSFVQFAILSIIASRAKKVRKTE